MTVDVERLDQLRRRAGRARGADLGVLPAYSAGTYVWAKYGDTRGILLARVLSPVPAAMLTISSIREWWSVEVFAGSLGIWNPRPHLRRVLRALLPTELEQLRDVGIIT